ncbi:hypothetical protein EVA_10782 [gut metagenome]|uniref:Uncharacterized protein n=1 Tax=gut metagenome TaxID=749906 RepID=J9GH10_9ZZZZ
MPWSTKSINHNRSAFQPKAPTQEKKVCRITRCTFFFYIRKQSFKCISTYSLP